MRPDRPLLRVGIVGCGLIGTKRAEALGATHLVACFDVRPEAARKLAEKYGAITSDSLDALLAEGLDVVVVATVHSELAPIAIAALRSGAHVLVEKPAGIGVGEIDAIAAAASAADRLVKVGFNHRFHPGIARAVSLARSGVYGEILYFRARYGHGGRLGYESEWRADPSRSGGGEIVDQGMHLIDLSNALLGELPIHSSLLRTSFWKAEVDDNAVLILGDRSGVGSAAPFSLLHVSWTEWKNTFSMEIACRTAKITVDGLGRSYGPETLRIYTMSPDLGPPNLDEVVYSDIDVSFDEEWRDFVEAISGGGELVGTLATARYAWSIVEAAGDDAAGAL